MKKYLILGLALCLFSSICFGEALFAPTLGYGLYSRSERNFEDTQTAQLSLGAFDVGFSIGSLGDGYFTFLYNTSFLVNPPYKLTFQGTGTLPTEPQKKVKGFLWNNEFLFGGTFRFVDNSMYLTLATGPTFSFGVPRMQVYNETTKVWEDFPYNVEDSMTAELGVAFHLEFSYFFLDWLGVSVSLTDTVGVAYDSKFGLFDRRDPDADKAKPHGFGNIFQVKAGPKFRVK